MVKLQESKGRFFVTVPKEYVALKNWRKGAVLILTLNDHGNIEILSVEQRPKQVQKTLVEQQQANP